MAVLAILSFVAPPALAARCCPLVPAPSPAGCVLLLPLTCGTQGTCAGWHAGYLPVRTPSRVARRVPASENAFTCGTQGTCQ